MLAGWWLVRSFVIIVGPIATDDYLVDITVDCDVLRDSDTDLKIVIHTAAPGSEDATKIELARVAGTQPARGPVHQGR